jgi:hypothetical protein
VGHGNVLRGGVFGDSKNSRSRTEMAHIILI